MITLTPEQRAIVDSRAKHRVVFAGAGCGKTATMVEVIRDLIEDRGRSAECITAISFTRAAAKELQDRVQNVVGQLPVRFGTSHSLALAILRHGANRIGWPSNLGIYDESDEADIRRSLAAIYKVTQEEIKQAVFNMRDPNPPTEHPSDSAVYKAARAYHGELTRAGCVDMDWIIPLATRILLEWPEVRSRWSYVCRILLVDEYHDTSPEEIAFFAALGSEETIVVGDAQQCIYGFRGTSNRYLVEAAQRQGAEVFTLSQSWRSAPQVVEAANNVVSHAALQTGLSLVPRPDVTGQVRYVRDSKLWIQQICNDLEDGASCAVLARTNAGVEAVLGILEQMGISAVPISAERPFYRQTAVRAFHAILRAYANPLDARATELVVAELLQLRRSPELEACRLRASEEDLPLLHVMDWAGYRQPNDLRMLSSWAADELIAAYERAHLTNRVEAVRRAHGRILEWLDREPSLTLADFLDWLVHREVIPERRPRRSAGPVVEVSTAHGAKGLEWDSVVIVEANEGSWPHRLSHGAEGLEEERRLWYVAVTRARARLTVLAGVSLDPLSAPPAASRFVAEMLFSKSCPPAGSADAADGALSSSGRSEAVESSGGGAFAWGGLVHD